MSRIEACLAELKNAGKKALVPYITSGDPDMKTTLALMHALAEAGADIIELGVPFSDPMADGPVIQLAFERALEKGTNIDQIFELIAKFRETNNSTPIVLMGYLNPFEVVGYETYVQRAKTAGADGFIIVDLPPEEAAEMTAICEREEMNLIFLLAPTTTPERIKLISDHASGYLYYVSLKGVTGASNLDIDDVTSKLDTIRGITDLPITVGFGIKDASTAAAVTKVADGAVVGSALVSRIAELQDTPEKIAPTLSKVIAEMRAAIDG